MTFHRDGATHMPKNDDFEAKKYLAEIGGRMAIGAPIAFWLMDYGQQQALERFDCPPDMVCNAIPIDPLFTLMSFGVLLLTLPNWREAASAYMERDAS